ncbi:MAG: DUF5392 family protein [Tuberibacillus sp.]
MNISMKNMPNFIKREMEKMEEPLIPYFKKASKYGIWAFPLIVFSLFNLVISLFFTSNWNISAIVIYAVIGALGMALSRESKLQRKAIKIVSFNYIIKRISDSDIAPEALKKEYILRIKKQPAMTLNFFINFLEEENKANIYG